MKELELHLTKAQKIDFVKMIRDVKTLDNYMQLQTKLLSEHPRAVNEQVFRTFVADYPNNPFKYQKLGSLEMDMDYHEKHVLTQESTIIPNSGPDYWQYALITGNYECRNYDLSYYTDILTDQYGLSDVDILLYNQKPGQVTGWHYDSMHNYYTNTWSKKYPDRIGLPFNKTTMWADDDTIPIRLFIPLEDWKYGQIFMFGNQVWANWSPGDVVWMDWRYTPHCTANASIYDRPFLRVTAIVNRGNPIYDMFLNA